MERNLSHPILGELVIGVDESVDDCSMSSIVVTDAKGTVLFAQNVNKPYSEYEKELANVDDEALCNLIANDIE